MELFFDPFKSLLHEFNLTNKNENNKLLSLNQTYKLEIEEIQT